MGVLHGGSTYGFYVGRRGSRWDVGRHTDKSRSSRYRDIGNLVVAIAISGK